jgi:hypothetical protein
MATSQAEIVTPQIALNAARQVGKPAIIALPIETAASGERGKPLGSQRAIGNSLTPRRTSESPKRGFPRAV